MKPTVVVIGAGVAGMSAAYHCARLGCSSVLVLEKATLASASSGLSAGIFNRQTFDPVDLALRVASGAQFAELERDASLVVNRCGYMRLVRTEEHWAKVLHTVESGDYPDTQLLERDQVAALAPGMRVDDVLGAMYGPDDGHVDGPELCAAYLQVGERFGVTYRPGTELYSGRTARGVTILETSNGSFAADFVVNAAGAWLDRVGQILGAPQRIHNELHEVALVNVPSLADRDVPTIQTYFPGSGEDAVYVRPEGRGRFIAGLHSYESSGTSADPDDPAPAMSDPSLETLAEQLAGRFPGWSDAGLRPGWSGIYPLGPDGRFVVGPHPDNPRIITVGGLGGVGLTVSPAIGRIAAEWIVLGGCSSFPFAEKLLPNRAEE